MAKGKNYNGPKQPVRQEQPNFNVKKVASLLDSMIDGREYASIVDCIPVDPDVTKEIQRAIREISEIRKRPVVCYVSNVINVNINASTGIDYSDDMPFLEMLNNVALQYNEVDIILVTPGGSAERVAHYVNQIRNRFSRVGFILPHIAMSAGTIFCLSGDEVVMTENACIGPIDPQVRSNAGGFVPAQAILTLIKEIQDRGEEALQKGLQPNWTDIQLLNKLDPKEIGSAMTASKFSSDLVTNYLQNYKFKDWYKHSSTGNDVTDEEKETRARDIAEQLCSHAIWKTHSRGITRDMASKQCRLQITHPESVEGLDRAIRRFWALINWLFEKAPIYKIFISDNYVLFRTQIQQLLVPQQQ